ncbi:dnaA initiator-associating protein isoform X2 [Wolffia australiana]
MAVEENRAIVPDKRTTHRSGGCIGVFIQFLDWNRRNAKRKFFPKKLLSQDRHSKNRSKPAERPLRTEEEGKRGLSRGNSIKPGLVARLMGLESMPASNKPKKLVHGVCSEVGKRTKRRSMPRRSTGRLMEAASKILEPGIHRRKLLGPCHNCGSLMQVPEIEQSSSSSSSFSSASSSRERKLRRRAPPTKGRDVHISNARVSSSSHGHPLSRTLLDRRIEELSFLLGQKIRELSSFGSAAAVLEELVAALSSRSQGEQSPMSIFEAPLSESFNSSSGTSSALRKPSSSSSPGFSEWGIRVSKSRSRVAVSMMELWKGKNVEDGEEGVYPFEWGLELEEELMGVLVDDLVFDLLA